MAAPVIPPPITARSNSSFCILLRLIFLVFGEKFPLEDLGFNHSMLASEQLRGVIKGHGMLEFWNNGNQTSRQTIPVFHYSIMPTSLLNF
jgi:hypothetical protein